LWGRGIGAVVRWGEGGKRRRLDKNITLHYR